MKAIFRLISVSALEWVLAIAIILGMVVYILVAIANDTSPLPQYFSSLEGKYTLPESYVHLSNEINSSEYVANGVVFAAWAIVGLLSYYLVYFFMTSERNASEFFKTLFWVHADKTTLLEYSIGRMAIRVASLMALLGTTVYFVTGSLPYMIGALNVSAATPLLPERLVPLALVCLSLIVYLHIYVVLLRCLTLRQRVFF